MGKAGGKSFERDISSALNRWYLEEDLQAIAYRRWAPPRTFQEFDVVSDSEDMILYMAIECKSVSLAQGDTLYWSQYFSIVDGVHQIDRESAWLKRTGRSGYLAVEIRGGPGKTREAYMVPWKEVTRAKRDYAIGMTIEKIMTYPRIARVGKQYIMSDEVLNLD
jgi:hypothetical protein